MKFRDWLALRRLRRKLKGKSIREVTDLVVRAGIEMIIAEEMKNIIKDELEKKKLIGEENAKEK